MQASFNKHTLIFKQASGTSRGILRTKDTYFLNLENNDHKGVGECGLFKGLSIDDLPDYEEKLSWVCENIQLGKDELLKELVEFPSIAFGLEQAYMSLQSKDPFILYPSNFTKGDDSIAINGLIWMGDEAFMRNQIAAKLDGGFSTLKLKIGAIDFKTELNLLSMIRKEFSADEIEIRVDANGAFKPKDALEKLERLSEYELHSIEQPIKPQQWQDMASLCARTPLPIALDEELIGVFTTSAKQKLLETIQPQYIILKPSLIGGFRGSEEWITATKAHNVGWWITSALESNIGLNAIAQYTYQLKTTMPQGLGTGSLFTNNISSPLRVEKGQLWYNPAVNWNINR